MPLYTMVDLFISLYLLLILLHICTLQYRLQDSILSSCKIDLYTPPSCVPDVINPFQASGSLDNYLSEVLEYVRARCDRSGALSAVPGKRNPLRIFMPALGGFDRHFSMQCVGQDSRKKVIRFFLRLKHMICNRDDCITLTLSTNEACHQDRYFLPGLTNIADNVFVVESFDGRGNAVPVEYRHFCAFFHVVKLSCAYSVTPFHPPSNHYGIKRDSRKLLIELLHLPPEEGDDADSTNTSAKSLSSGQSCSASISNLLKEI